MEILELVYVSLGTIGILLFLHLATFWVARLMQPQKPKIVYVQAPQPQPQPPPPPPVLSQAPPTIQLPTYDAPPAAPTIAPVGQLPPPLETRSATKQSGGDIGAPR
jgi:hypothetical protein